MVITAIWICFGVQQSSPGVVSMWTCAGVLALAACACAVTRDQFYPYGPTLDASLPKGQTASSPEVPLKVPITFYGESYETIFVSFFCNVKECYLSSLDQVFCMSPCMFITRLFVLNRNEATTELVIFRDNRSKNTYLYN